MAAVRGVRGAITQTVKVVARGRDLLPPRRRGLTVLIYHRVGGPGGSVDLDPARFDEQMAELAASGRVVPLDQGIDELEAGIASESVAITFDDGTVDFVEHAVPVLERHRVPATLYLATKFADEGLDFPGGGPAVSWAGLRDAVATGLVEVGSHTHSHVLLDRAPAIEVATELDRSIDLITGQLDRPVRHFAYPKALLGSPESEAEVRQRFRSAAVAGTRPNPPGVTDLHRLHRSPIQVADGMQWFRRKAAGGMALEDDLRQLVNRRRYAEATS